MNLEKKFYLYKSKNKREWNQDDCDSLLFESLRACIQGEDINIDSAFDGKYWYRRPNGWVNKCYDCFRPENKEKLLYKIYKILKIKYQSPKVAIEYIIHDNWYKGSTISRDMLTGLSWYAYYNKRLDISEQIINHALKNFGVMGEGDPTRVNIMPPLLSTYAWISYKLGGPSRPWLRWIPLQTNECYGFEAHLQVLQIMLRYKLIGSLTKKEQKVLSFQADRCPDNPLFSIAVGNLDKAEEVLSRESLWPENRLPTNYDRKEPWLPQRDNPNDWLPEFTEQKIVHPGSDFIFCYGLLKNKTKLDNSI